MKTVWRSQNAFVAIKTNYIGRTLKEGRAMTTLSKMLVGWGRDRHRYSLKYLSRLLGSLFPWFSHFFRSPSQPSILPESWSEYVSQHQTGTPKPALPGSGRYSQNSRCFRDA